MTRTLSSGTGTTAEATVTGWRERTGTTATPVKATDATVTGWCRRGDCDHCHGSMLTGTGWNWWCTHGCHPEPTIKNPAHQPALDFWRKHRRAT